MGNRHSEILLRDVEHLATLASLRKTNYTYPKIKIDDNWEKVLLNQCMSVPILLVSIFICYSP